MARRLTLAAHTRLPLVVCRLFLEDTLPRVVEIRILLQVALTSRTFHQSMRKIQILVLTPITRRRTLGHLGGPQMPTITAIVKIAGRLAPICRSLGMVLVLRLLAHIHQNLQEVPHQPVLLFPISSPRLGNVLALPANTAEGER